MLQGRLNLDSGPNIQFAKIGRNKATVFSGLCSEHDSELFRPIDDSPFDSNSDEHKFLIAYRSVLRELHAKMNGATIVHNQFGKAVELGKIDPNSHDPIGMAATIAIAEAYSFYRFKWDFDKWYRERRFDLLEHICLTVNTVPSLAVSAAYSTFDTMKSLPNRLNPPTVILNVFPVSNNKTIALFSFKKAHREYFIPHTSTN
jgi:hypothetical protein